MADASSFTRMAELAQHNGFRARVRIALVTVAAAVGAEANDGTETSRLRRAHAANVLGDQDKWTEQYVWIVASNPALLDPGQELASPDTDLQDTVISKFNAVAGAPPATNPPAA